MFKVIDNNLTTIFNRVQDVTTGVNLSTDSVNRYVEAFNNINTKQKFGYGWEQFLKGMNAQNGNMATYFEDLAKQGASAKASIQGVYAAILDGNTRGLSNVKSIVSTFNSLDPKNQQAFAAAVGQTNKNLGTYLSGINNANASMGGYAAQLVATTAKTIALKVATMALNAGLAMVVSYGLTKLVSKIRENIKTQEELKEANDELVSSFKSLKEETDGMAQNANDLIPEYVKLAKGVNNLGENVSLTTDEYDRYHEITNQIAEDVPDLIQGYDDEGNAILRLRDNVDDLKQSYIDARKEKYNLLLAESTTDDALKNYQNYANPGFGAWITDVGDATVGKKISTREAISALEFALQSTNQEMKDELLKTDGALSGYKFDYLATLGFSLDTTEEEFAQLQKVFSTNLKQLQAEVNTGLAGVRSTANAYLYTDDDFYQLNDSMQNFASTLVNNIPDELASTWGQENDIKVDINDYVSDIVDALSNATPEVQKAFEELTNFNSDGLSVTDAKEQVDKYVSELSNYLNVDENQIKVSFGLEYVDDNSEELQRVLNKAAQEFDLKLDWTDSVEELGVKTKEDIQLLSECIDEAIENAEKGQEMAYVFDLFTQKSQELNNAAAEESRTLEELQETYEELSKSVSSYTSNQKTLNSALEEQKEHGQLSASTIQELVEAGYAAALSIDGETGAVTLNQQAYERLAEARQEDIRLQAEQQKSELIAKIHEEEAAIVNLNQSYATANAISEERQKQLQQEIEKHSEALGEYRELYESIIALYSSLGAPTYDSSSSSGSSSTKNEKPERVTNFENAYAEYQHEKNMGRKKEDADYYDWLETEAHKAYDGLEDYQSDLWKYEEEVYKGRKQLEEDLLEEKENALDEHLDYYKDRIEELENQIDITSEDSTDYQGNKLSPAEKFAYIRDCYDEILNNIEAQINEIVQSGLEGHEDELKELEKQYEEYLDKKNSVFEDEVQYEIDYIENLQDKLSDEYDKRIDKLESEKDAVEKRYDTEIDKIDETIDALQKKNDENQLALDIEKARQDVENAKQKTRKVYGGDGTVQYRQDDEKVAEAQEKLDDLLLEQLINSYEEQKKSLETEKEAALDKYDIMIETLQAEKENQVAYYTDLLNILDAYLNPESTQDIESVWDKILDDEGNVKLDNGSTDVKGENVDTSAVSDKKVNADEIIDRINSDSAKVNGEKADTVDKKTTSDENKSNLDNVMVELFKKVGATADTINKYLKGELTQQISNLIGFNPATVKVGSHADSKDWRMDRQGYQVTNNKEVNAPTFTIGDIIINNPVGNSDDLVKELRLNLRNSFMKQKFTNLK